jgi:hypothetical protein
MSVVFVTPWGDEPIGTPDMAARQFAHAHWQAGHRYTVTGTPGSYEVECECGKRSRPDGVDFPVTP